MLKALELNGFKSFADKTRLEFGAGVTCVVGPNGSGKSNVVDAMKWVAGTQSAKALRGKEMTDVIFSGSASRKPMNAAEVTLEFDNSEGLFEVQAPVARITRRVYRSGEGEYLINGSPSRLRDIRALLAGTGVGAESYSIIEQGRVDAMLRASPRDRRGIFEEAAGVSRFRLKKQEAAKRLARVEQNLLRLSDIVDEVEGRLRRVKKQAGKAQRYRESADRLKQLRTDLGVADYLAFAQRGERLSAELQRIKHQNQHDTQTLAAAEEELDRIDSESGEVTASLRVLDQRLADLREQMGAARATMVASSDRVVELEEELQHKQARLAAELASAATLIESAARVGLAEQLNEAESERDGAAERFARLSEHLTEAQERLAASIARHAQADESLREANDAAAQTERRQTQLAREISEKVSRVETLTLKMAALSTEIDKLEADREAGAGAVAETALRVESSTAALASRHTQTSALREQLAEAQKQLSTQQTQAIGLRHQLEAINQLENNLRDLHKALPSQASGIAWQALGMVADVLHVDYDSAPMVEAALGERAHHLVVDSGASLIEQLAQGAARLSSCTSLERLDSHAPASVVDRVDLTGEPGVMGRADQFVECEAQLLPLVRRLLGRVWFVDTLATAERLSQSVGRGLSYVTYTGESLTADGVLTIGPRNDSRNLLTRKARAEEVRTELAAAEGAAEKIQSQAAELEHQVAESQGAERDDLRHRTEAADANAEARHALQRVEERLAVKRTESRKRAADRQELQAELATVEAELEALSRDAQEHTRRLAELNDAAQAASADRTAAEPLADSLRQQAVDAQVRLARAEQRVEVLQLQSVEPNVPGAKPIPPQDETQQEIAAYRQRIEQQQRIQLSERAKLDSLSLAAHQLAEERRQTQQATAGLRERRSAIAQAVRERRSQSDRQVEQQQRLELELARLQQQQQTLFGRLRDDYGIDLKQAATGQAAQEIDDRQALEREIASLREDVVAAGAVNLESIEELDDLETRFNELSRQYQDLSTAKNSLERLMQRLGVESRKLFLSAIEAVRGEFRELFRQLFGGGEADLILVEGDGDDPLDAGVEIVAQPPGKDLSNITLLSGGEKTLTCVALLLALFRAKPSPFCVLDEVDAALDEANIGRFTGLLNEFLSSTQFIVITHSKKTMTGADTMYGITMQESGISKQVAVRFEEVDEQGNIRPSRMLNSSKRAA